ncbi:GNAT family N-acetyltransferase [Paenibacillus sp. CC-CFT747]|nr:GNAT family N-acetyltransferase [Paenibacillus sp. CC-CFT747]
MKSRKLIKGYMDKKDARAALNELAGRVFGLSFEEWYQAGGWDGRYVPYSFLEGHRLAANVSVSRLELVMNGKRHKAVQIGTVMTAPECRGQGLAAALMREVLADYETECDVFYLFANRNVLEFYPRFGFRPIGQRQFRLPADRTAAARDYAAGPSGAGEGSGLPAGSPGSADRFDGEPPGGMKTECGACLISSRAAARGPAEPPSGTSPGSAAPAFSRVRKLDLRSPADWTLLTAFARERVPNSERFDTSGTSGLLMFYAQLVLTDHFYFLEDLDVIVVYEQREGVTHLYDIVARAPYDTEEVLACIPVAGMDIVFHFTPNLEPDRLIAEPFHGTEVLFVRTRQGVEWPESFKHPMTSQA